MLTDWSVSIHFDNMLTDWSVSIHFDNMLTDWSVSINTLQFQYTSILC